MGAPGAGVSTLGKALARQLGFAHFDTDDYHWFTSDPEPYRRRRNPEHRRQLLGADLQASERWVLSGSLCGWGDVFIPSFHGIVYCWLPAEIRLNRILQRETARYGAARLAPGGDLHTVFEKFLGWAAMYDEPGTQLRSREQELRWLERTGLPALMLEEEAPVEALCERVLSFLEAG